MTIKHVLFFIFACALFDVVAMNPSDFMMAKALVNFNYDPRTDGSYVLTHGLDHFSHNRPRWDPINDLNDYLAFKKCVSKWLRMGTSINSVDRSRKWSPLSRAAYRGDLWQCRYLLKLGADINNAHAKYTPLLGAMKCIRSTRAKVFRFLLEHGADINQAGRTGETPLLLFLSRPGVRWDGVIRLQGLLGLGADPLRCDKGGWNALMHAVQASLMYASRFDSPLFIILEHLMRKKYTINWQLLSFLCCVNRLRSSKSWNEKVLGSVLFHNRSSIILYYQESTFALKDILSMCDHYHRRVYDMALQSERDRLILEHEKPGIECLDPNNAQETERIIVERIRKIDAEARAPRVRQERRAGAKQCVVQ